ncbi:MULTISPECIES: DUF6438 domain-containing protein [Chryseobacterium]|uniref:DUF6438 domain-containing protein n=1 Tax=Chryseobacterium TaxID=59732 RepID=UPI000AD334AE|nr:MULTISPECIES: DUF6438 domain-containing protein [Chryseobacterium]
MMKYIVSAIFFLLITACSSKKAISNSPIAETITLTKNLCFGSCPVYTIEIRKNGNIRLDAKNSVKNNLKGVYTSTLSKEDLNSVNALDFTLLKDSYGNREVSDLPSTDIEIHLPDGKTKKINDYGNHGSFELEKLYQHIDILIGKLHWEKVK